MEVELLLLVDADVVDEDEVDEEQDAPALTENWVESISYVSVWSRRYGGREA